MGQLHLCSAYLQVNTLKNTAYLWKLKIKIPELFYLSLNNNQLHLRLQMYKLTLPVTKSLMHMSVQNLIFGLNSIVLRLSLMEVKIYIILTNRFTFHLQDCEENMELCLNGMMSPIMTHVMSSADSQLKLHQE